jgi:hypothetical protein
VLKPIIHLLNRISHALLNYADRNVSRAARKQGWTAEQEQAFRDHIADIRAEMDKPCDHCGKKH